MEWCLFPRVLLISVIFGSFFLEFIPAAKVPSPIQRVLVMEYFEICDQKDYPVQYLKYTFVRNGTQIILNGGEVVTRDINNPIMVHFRIVKCKDKSNPDTCEYYTTWKWENICAIMKILPFLKVIGDAHTPPVSCPLKKGRYYLRNAKVETALVTRFLSDGESTRTLWKFRTQLLEKNQTVACLDFALRVANLRN